MTTEHIDAIIPMLSERSWYKWWQQDREVRAREPLDVFSLHMLLYSVLEDEPGWTVAVQRYGSIYAVVYVAQRWFHWKRRSSIVEDAPLRAFGFDYMERFDWNGDWSGYSLNLTTRPSRVP